MCLGGVGGQVDLFGRAALVLWVHHHTVAREAFEAAQSVLLTRHSPAYGERGGANLGGLEVGGG